MTTFIWTPTGFINMDQVREVRIDERGKRLIITDAGIVDHDSKEFDQAILSLVPVQGDWEALSGVNEDDGTQTLAIEPVIAWALTPGGKVRPVVATDSSCGSATWAVRKKGYPEIYTSSCTYDTLEVWAKSEGIVVSKAIARATPQ